MKFLSGILALALGIGFAEYRHRTAGGWPVDYAAESAATMWQTGGDDCIVTEDRVRELARRIKLTPDGSHANDYQFQNP